MYPDLRPEVCWVCRVRSTVNRKIVAGSGVRPGAHNVSATNTLNETTVVMEQVLKIEAPTFRSSLGETGSVFLLVGDQASST